MTIQRSRRLYIVPVLSKAIDILELLQAESRPMTLEALHRETKIAKTTVYRVLRTFVHRGYLSVSQDGLYRQATRPRKLRFGFGGRRADIPFSIEVAESLKLAAASAGVDLMILDNCDDPATAVCNADEFVKNRVDLVIEFQMEEEVTPVIADKIAAAKIPMISIGVACPHATFFGVDNYRAGFEAGEVLAEYALQLWDGQVEWILGLDLCEAGVLMKGRIAGAFDGVRRAIPDLRGECFIRTPGWGKRDCTRELVSDFLDRHPHERHILIAAATDTIALGALDAVRDRRREKHVVIVGQECTAESIAEMTKPRSPLIGSVSHKAQSYGSCLVHLGLSLLRGQTVAPYNYVAHQIVTSRSAIGDRSERSDVAPYRFYGHDRYAELETSSSSL